MKKLIALLLAVLMIASLAACGGSNTETTADTTTEPETTTTEPETTEPETTEGNVIEGISYFSLSMGEDYDHIKSLSAYYNEDGTVAVEYNGDIRKMGNLEASVMATIDEALKNAGLAALNGQEDYKEGNANASMYITYGDGTMLTAGFSGEIPEAFSTAFAAMDTCFQTITAELPEYVPQPMVMGEIAESDKTALDGILAGMTLEMPDSFMISGVAKDEYFAAAMGLSSDAGIASGVSFAPMMLTSAYSLNIVTLEEGTSVDTVAADFNTSLDWLKWVCVQPSNALIATKGNQVLCLMGGEDLYTQTVSAIEAAGWTTVQSLTNPNM
ncbi:MAG: hypothetical protein J6B67_03160 [Oscillospiraceae bacterium]|nr:hypothetical protein [Oscillospiraceae bacterium]